MRKKKPAKQGAASFSCTPFGFFLAEDEQEKMKTSGENLHFFKTFNGKNHKTNLSDFALFMEEVPGIYISHLLSWVGVREYERYA